MLVVLLKEAPCGYESMWVWKDISEEVCKMFLEWLCSSVYYHGRVVERAESFICITVYRDAEPTRWQYYSHGMDILIEISLIYLLSKVLVINSDLNYVHQT